MTIHISMAIKERTMSQRTQQDQDHRRAPTQKHEKQEKPITGLSPDDPLGGGSDSTGKPGGPIK
jgi:hypothetical protein